ncbi:MAG: hypothetical protein QM710_11575 [Flavobacterium sp.]
MLKQIITGFMLLANIFAFSQVGVQTTSPKATLDVVGKPTDVAEKDGIIAPRLTGAQLRAKTYGSDQIGALVYVTAADTSPAGQTIDVTQIGYYYFNGTKWVITGSNVNIYNSNGSLTGYRVVDLNGHTLTFKGSEGYFDIEEGGSHATLHGDVDRAHFRFSTADLDGDGVTSQFDMDLFQDNYMQMFGSGEMDGISFGTHYTQNPSPIEFVTCPGGDVSGETRMTIMGAGNVGVNLSSPTEKFQVAGNVRFSGLPLNGATNAIYTTSGGGTSSTQNQTFTATRTLVSNNNGVLGYVTGTPLASEVDGVIGNEVTNATTNGGLVRAGSGTSASPYTLGLTSGTATGDVMTWNGTQWAPAASAITASNGLTLSSGNIKLGGTLTENTTITETDKTLTFNTTTQGGNKFISNGTAASPKAALQIKDGGESTGRVLTSDSTGNATWQDPTLFTVTGTFSTLSVTLPTSNSTRYTGASITLPPGKWMVNLGSTVSSGSPTTPTLTAGSIWVTYTLQDINTGTLEVTTPDYITTYSGNRAAAGMINIGAFKCFVSGVFAIQNSGTTSKTYYVWVQQERNAVAPTTATVNGAMASTAWERYFYAIRIL